MQGGDKYMPRQTEELMPEFNGSQATNQGMNGSKQVCEPFPANAKLNGQGPAQPALHGTHWRNVPPIAAYDGFTQK